MPRHEVYLDRDDGTRLALLDQFESLEYALVVNDIGACTIVLPGSFASLVAPDRRIEVWRAPESGKLAMQRVYFTRKIKDQTDRDGNRWLIVTGYDGNYLLAGRIVAYAVGSAQASQTDQADDLMKSIVDENLGSGATDSSRDWSGNSLTVQADLAAGPSLTRGFSRRNVLTVLQDLAESARQAGTEVYFDVVSTTPTALEFQTFTGQRGRDHTYPNGSPPVLLGVEFSNLAEPEHDQDYSDEVTFAYAGGQGEGSERVIQTAEDTTRSGRSIWGRREGFADARNESAAGGVTAAAQALVAEGRPRRRFTGRIVDTPGTRYGVHWAWGDKVTAVYEGQSFDAHIRAVRVTVDKGGLETTIDARLETDE